MFAVYASVLSIMHMYCTGQRKRCKHTMESNFVIRKIQFKIYVNPLAPTRPKNNIWKEKNYALMFKMTHFSIHLSFLYTQRYLLKPISMTRSDAEGQKQHSKITYKLIEWKCLIAASEMAVLRRHSVSNLIESSAREKRKGYFNSVN